MADLPPTQAFPIRSLSADTPSPQTPKTSAGEMDAARMSVPASTDESAERGRYLILQVHAQGGLGKVSLARDTSLGRTVALKEIRTDRRADETQRHRFINEATITGLLEHPGIVPIYTLDSDAEGKPYYAMRFIQGRTLSVAIEEHHANPTPLGFRSLLQRFIAVCQTMAYAHSKGVIHRDLKPENIMLGAYGETLVVDWGLAKQLQHEACPLSMEESPHQGEQQAAIANHPIQTQEGSVMGTPAYMAPEQARGTVDAQGPLTDIYALGAVLFTVLTGLPPYAGSLLELVERLQKNPSPPQAKEAPAALAAICAKAMAAHPSQRYGTANDLARDVERWLADEPTSVYREPWAVQARRWMRRHRAVVTSVVGILAVAVPLLVAGLFLVEQARRRESLAKESERGAKEQEQQAKIQALAARDRERTAKLKARQAVTTLFSERHLELLERSGTLTPEQTQQLQSLANFYRDCAQEAAGTLQEQVKQAADYFQLGKVLARLEQTQEAIVAYGYSIQIGKQLQALDPHQEEYQAGVARALSNLGTLHYARKDFASAINCFHQARDIQMILRTKDPHEPTYQAELALTWNNLAELELERGHHVEAERGYVEARQLLTQLVEQQPQTVEYKYQLGKVWNNLGVLQVTLGDNRAAESSQRAAISRFTALLQEHPRDVEIQAGAAGAWYSLGYVLRVQERFADAEKSFHQALDLYQQMAKSYPGTPDYQARLARTYRSLGVTYRMQKKLVEATQQFTRAQQAFEQLTKEHPGNLDYQTDLAGVWNNLGVCQWLLGKRDRAEASYRESQRIYETILKRAPATGSVLTDLAAVYANLGDLPASRGDAAAALVWYDRAVGILEPVVAREPRFQAARNLLRNSLGCRARSLHQLSRFTEAVGIWQRSLDFDDGTLQNYLKQQQQASVDAALIQARAQVRLGWHRPAGQTASLVASHQNLSSESCAEAARILARCSGLQVSWLPPNMAEREGYASQAVVLLRRCRGQGFFTDIAQSKRWQSDPDLVLLCNRADFRALLATAER